MYWHSYFNINDFDENADYAVFDDIAGGSSSSLITKDGWVHKNIHCDRQVPGEEAYRLGKPCIMLMNEDPTIDSHVDSAWLLGNCDIIFVPDNEPIVNLTSPRANISCYLYSTSQISYFHLPRDP